MSQPSDFFEKMVPMKGLDENKTKLKKQDGEGAQFDNQLSVSELVHCGC